MAPLSACLPVVVDAGEPLEPQATAGRAAAASRSRGETGAWKLPPYRCHKASVNKDN